MAHGAALDLTLRRLTRLIRQRRAMFYGVRGLGWGLCLAVVPVALRAIIGPWALPLAGGLAAGGLLAGAAYGLILGVPPVDALGVADRAFDLKDRLATAHDLLGRPARGALAEAAIDDAEEHARRIALERAVPWRWPREAKLLPAPVLVLAVLPYLPPVPVLDVSMPSFTPATEEEKKPEAAGPQQAVERPTPRKTEKVERVEMQDRDYQTRPNPESREHAKGDLAAASRIRTSRRSGRTSRASSSRGTIASGSSSASTAFPTSSGISRRASTRSCSASRAACSRVSTPAS
jgi:hypothetical protein